MSSYLSICLCLSICLSICHVTFSRPLIGQKWECYIVEEVIDVDELNEGNISASAGNKTNYGVELCHTWNEIKLNLINQIKSN